MGKKKYLVVETNNSSQILSDLDQRRDFQVNWGYLILFAIVGGGGMFQLGYVYTANNQVSSTLDVQFNLQTKEEKNFYHTFIGSSAVLGAAFGSFAGGKLIQYGRRKMLLIFNIVGVFAVLSTLFLNFYAICLGRLLFGFCGGIFGVALPRMIGETVPAYLLGTFGIVTNLSLNAGGMVAIVMGAGLPDDDEGKRETQFWRVIFGLPWIFQAINIPAFIFLIKYESIKYLLDNGRTDEAQFHIQKVYHSSENHKEIYDYLVKTSSKPSESKVSVKEGVIGSRYWRATWFCVVFIMLGQLTGINAIIWYSNSILTRMYTPGSALTPKLGTVLIGVCNFLGSCIALFTARHLGRKTLVLGGHAIMGPFLILVGVFSYLEINVAALSFILLFIMLYQMADGSVTYLYVPEVVVDSALGFCFLILKATALAISLTTEYLMDSPLHPYGAFWLFGGCTCAGAVYLLIFMKETKDLNDKEKKQLYIPENLRDNLDISNDQITK